MSDTISQPPEGGQPLTAEAVMREVTTFEGLSGDSMSHLEMRVIALEEALISRRARRRLRRVIRQADRDYTSEHRPTFRHRRVDACADDEALWGWQGGLAIGGPAIERDYWPDGGR